MKIAIHQPEYLCPLSLLDKARRADALVILDDVQFNRASLQHRAKIAPPPPVFGRPQAPFSWLTIPFVHRHPQDIQDVRPVDHAWPARHLEMLRAAYRSAEAAGSVLPKMEDFYKVRYETVASAARCSLLLLCEAFGLRISTLLSSSLQAEGHKGDRVLDLCVKLGATTYLSGRSGASYLDREAFQAAGIEIEVQAFEMPRYREGQPEVPGLSAIDAWMYLGDKAKEILCKQ